MKMYGNTCPLCCGDVRSEHIRASDGFCSFCDLSFAVHDGGFQRPGRLATTQWSPAEPPQDLPTRGYVLATILPARAAPAGGPHAV